VGGKPLLTCAFRLEEMENHCNLKVSQFLTYVLATNVLYRPHSDLSFITIDGRLGWPDLAPYDAIHVGAAAPEVPKPLIEQLKPGGRMVIPVGDFFQDLQVIDKQLDGSLKVHSETSVRYVPLTSSQEQLHGH
jgi:protein-L-isoaspartate(D-aspartate) O-methyltransferase